MSTKNELDIHQFFDMLLRLGICDAGDIMYEPYDMLGWHICEAYKHGDDLNTWLRGHKKWDK